jgi:MFS family permease
MSLYALAVIASSGLGPMIAGWIEANPSLQWRWIHWIQAMCSVIRFHPAVVILTIS